MRRLLVRPLAATAVALGILLSLGAPANTQTLTPIHVGTLSNDDTTALIYAQRSGLFTKAGLDVQIDRSSANGSAIAAAVTAGTYDIGKSSTLSLIQAHVRNIPFSIVAPAAIYESKAPYGGLCVRKESPVQAVTDLKSETIGLSTLHDIGELAIFKALDEAGKDYKGIQFTEIPSPTAPAAVEQGRVAGSECQYPVLTDALASGKVRLIPIYNAFGSAWTLTAYFTTKDYAAKHADAIKTFARVIADAARYANANHDVTAPMLAAFSNVSVDTVKKTPRVTVGTTMSASGIQSVIDAAAKYGMISKGFPAAELIDPAIIVK